MRKIGYYLFFTLAAAFILNAAYSQTDKQKSEETVTIVRQFIYRQITNWKSGREIDKNPLLSKLGNRIVFCEQGDPSRVFSMNLDGQDQEQVDSFQTGRRVEFDLSADGGFLVSTDAKTLHVTQIDHPPGREWVAFNSDQIADVSISGNGKSVFFLLKSDTTIKGTSRVVKRGLYYIEPNTRELQAIVTAQQIADLLEIEMDRVTQFSGSGSGLDVSFDGDRLVFVVTTMAQKDLSKRERIFTVSGTGEDLQEALSPSALVYSVGISGNGKVLAYVSRDHEGPIIGGVVEVETKKKKRLVEDPPSAFADPVNRVQPSQLNEDGTKVLFGGSSLLFDLKEGTTLQLDTPLLATEQSSKSFCCVSMNSSADRFLYLMEHDETAQLGLLEINPEELLTAPVITEPTLIPRKISKASGTLATITARVEAEEENLTVSGSIYNNGVLDPQTAISLGLFDDGENRGDKVADDGIFTNNTLRALQKAEKGPRTIRIAATVTDADGKQHTSVLEYGMLEVVE